MSDVETWMVDRMRRRGESRMSVAGLLLLVLEARGKAAEADKVEG